MARSADGSGGNVVLTLLTQFIRRSRVIAFIKSLDGRYQVISDAWLRTFHTTETAVVGHTDLELFGEEGSKDFLATDRQVLETGEPIEHLDPVQVGTERRTYLSTKFLLFDQHGQRTGLAGFAVDVTEQQRVLDALRASEQRARDLVDQGPLAYVVFDVEARAIVDANRNAQALFHATREQLLAADPWDLSPPTQPDGSPSVEAGRRFFARLAEGTQSFDWTHRTLDGQPLATRVWFSREEHRSRHQVRVAILDLREIERANLELSRHRRFLEQTQAMARVGGWELDVARAAWCGPPRPRGCSGATPRCRLRRSRNRTRSTRPNTATRSTRPSPAPSPTAHPFESSPSSSPPMVAVAACASAAWPSCATAHRSASSAPFKT